MIKLYKKYLPKYKLHLIFGPLFKILEAIFELLVPLVIKFMIDNIINNHTILDNTIKIQRLWACGGVLFAFAIGGFATTMIAQYIACRASQGFGTDIRDELYKHINTLSYKELDKISAPSLINRLQNDVINVQHSVAMLIRLVLRAPFIVIGATIMSFVVNVKAGFIFLAATISLFIIIFVVGKIIIPYSKRMQKELDTVTRISKENLAGNRVVRAFNKEDYEKSRFVVVENKLTDICVKLSTRESLLNPLTFLVVNAATIIVLFFSGIQFPSGGITQGDIQALVNYFTQIQLAVVAVTNLVLIFSKASASAHRVNEVFALSSSIKYGELDRIDKSSNEIIKFNNVSFKYNETSNPAIKDVSFTVNKGETIGIIGGTGSGKSTIVNLLNRFYDVTSGSVHLYNHDIKEYKKDVINSSLSTVMQKSVLFNGTIRSNLLKAKKEASEEELARALKIAQVSGFVGNLDKGLDYEIYQSGKNLSGGQRQRLSIARALVKDAPILILDDSSSALDYKTDSDLRNEISKLNKTTIIISQRARSILKANKILVMDKGTLVGVGTHQELLFNNKIYQEICASQDVKEVANV